MYVCMCVFVSGVCLFLSFSSNEIYVEYCLKKKKKEVLLYRWSMSNLMIVFLFLSQSKMNDYVCVCVCVCDSIISFCHNHSFHLMLSSQSITMRVVLNKIIFHFYSDFSLYLRFCLTFENPKAHDFKYLLQKMNI